MVVMSKNDKELVKAQEGTETSSEINEYQTRLELFYEVIEQANSVQQVSDLIEEILHVTQKILKASTSSLLLINEETKECYLRAVGGSKSDALRQIKVGSDSGIIGWVAHNAKPVVVNNVYEDKRFNKEIDEAPGLTAKSIMAAPVFRGQKFIGVLEMINKSDGNIFNDRDLRILTGLVSTEAFILLVSMAAIAINNIELCQIMKDQYTVDTLATSADDKDPYAKGHSHRVKEYTLLAANSLEFPFEELKVIEYGAMLHDIGKIGITGDILSKAGPLTNEELYIIRKHPLIGANIVSEIPSLEKTKDMILFHHERFDGAGYPSGLKGDEIPIGACLIAVADAFDTMTTDHSYRASLGFYKAMTELIQGIGTQFHPKAVEALLSGFEKHKDGPEPPTLPTDHASKYLK